MTAEIAVLNSVGVALAADSAVTVSREAGKVYLSADKLFQLSEHAPIGVMVYGNASLLNVPWETIVKCYRKSLGERTFPKLEDYSRDFLAFLRQSRHMFPAARQEDDIRRAVSLFFSYLRDEFKKTVEKEYHEGRNCTEAQLKRLFTDLVTNELGKSKEWPVLDALSGKSRSRIKGKYTRLIGNVRANVFERLPTSQLTQRRLLEVAVETLTRRRLIQSGSSAGVVIAGFGEDEHFPKLVGLQLLGIAADNPLYYVDRRSPIDTGTEAIVVSLAQSEMVQTFMDGIDPYLQRMMEESTKALFHQMAAIILMKVKSKHPRYGRNLEKDVVGSLDKLLPGLYDGWHEIRRENYASPVMQMVGSLPKDELGAMAEALVNLTKFKRRVSKEQETVGGPIDVAIITKGDGFVWMKRKHYFAAELNPRYMARIARWRKQ